ncbi:MAG: Yip1 family protein [Lentimicrobium sp.]|jgi:hypothetical protein|nr:Yip1 family protein [Lentimicrobium sp.]
MQKINFFERLKSLLLFPSYEWKVISLEKRPLNEDFNQFAFRLILLGALAQFIGSFIYVRNELDIDAYRFSFPLVQAGFYIIIQVTLLLISAFFVNRMALKFGSVRHFKSSARLVMYSASPVLLMYVLVNLNSLFFLALIPGLYSFYLFWVGLPILMGTKQAKRFSFVLIYLIFTIGMLWMLSLLFGIISGLLFPGSF